MNKKRTKAIRNFLALLVLLTTGGTQQVWADEPLEEGQLVIIGSGTIENATYNGCNLLRVDLTVNPGADYYTNLNLITATNEANQDPNNPMDPSQIKKFRQYSNDENDLKTVDPADLTKNYSGKRTITIYWVDEDDNGPSSDDILITVKFKPIGLELLNGLGEFNDALPGGPDDIKPRATVTFYEPNDDFDPENPAKFNPTDYLGDDTGEHLAKMPATVINNTDGEDRWVIAHIVPANGCWTDESILFAIEAGALQARAKTIGFDPGQQLKLLKADEYNAASSGEDPDMKPCQNGAGWYYYKLLGSHKFSFEDTGYKYSIINGFAPEKFQLHNSERITMEDNVLTVTDGTANGWKAVLTYDQMNFTFDCDTHCPQVTNLSVSYQGATLLDFDGTTTEGRAAIDRLVECGPDPIPVSIWPTHYVQTRDAQGYPNGWFVGTEYVAIYSIDVPFMPLKPTDAVNPPGSENNPWLIRNADELNLLSKCHTIGDWYSEEQYLLQTADIDMSEVNDFLPIGINYPGVSFKGHYNGNNKTISGIKVTYSTASDNPFDPTDAYVGLFGLVEGNSDFPASVENVTLVNCSFSATAGSCAVAVGGIAGSIQGSNPEDATISNCKVLVNGESATSAISGLPTGCATGAIVGNFLVGSLSQNYYGYGVTVSNSSGTANGYTKRGTWMGTVSGDGDPITYSWVDFTLNDGAMLYVKKATIVGGSSTNGSAVTFNEVTKGTDRYDKDGDDFYYAVGQPVTLSVTLESQTEKTDIRTFYDELTALTMNDGTTDTDIKDALGFTMPEADATVTATIAESKWFTIPSNGMNWMSFYHEWTNGDPVDGVDIPANYTVTACDDPYGTEIVIDVKTITNVNPETGEFSTGDINGCYSGEPTLFHYDDGKGGGLPALLKFKLDENISSNVDNDYRFWGTIYDFPINPTYKIYVLNNAGDFIFAYPTDDDKTIKAHHCYIDLTNYGTAAPARLTLSGNDTGIDTIFRDATDGAWYSLDGRRLDRQPAKKGIYIYKGKKAVIK